MRRSELVSLRWKNIDLARHVARVATKSKVAGRMRDVPLSKSAITILKAMPRRLDGKVFGGKADTFTRAFVRSAQRARERYVEKCEASGSRPAEDYLVNVRLHDLRHEGTSRFARHLHAQELARATGHATLQMVMRYYNPTAEELAEKISSLT
jgi:integrase